MRISDWSSDVCSSDLEYLEERYPEPSLLGSDPVDRAEVRRLTSWFGEKFHREVTANLVDEKIMKRFLKLGTPNSGAIRAGLANIHYHLEYIAWLSDRRRWLAGDAFSRADIVAAAELSAVDYSGGVPWAEHGGRKSVVPGQSVSVRVDIGGRRD